MESGRGVAAGDFAVDGVAKLVKGLRGSYGFLSDFWALRLVRAYGTEAFAVLGDAKSAADLGVDFGASLTAREVAWLMDFEYARHAEDVVWRRSKLGLRMDAAQVAALEDWMKVLLDGGAQNRGHDAAYSGD